MKKISFCRDCLSDLDDSDITRCKFCRSPRVICHQELDKLSIAHIDCDSFFAAVEKKDNPELANLPVIVGGTKRGVVSTCCYIARSYGIKSAMPIFLAKKLCPNAIYLKPRHERYRSVSKELRHFLEKLTPEIEFISIDEGYLNLRGTNKLHGMTPAKAIAKIILEIEKRIGITVSIGLSYNKTLAKIASTQSKPRGFSIIGKNDSDEFLATLSVEKISGIGEKLSKKLNSVGIFALGDILKKNRKELLANFGDTMIFLYNLLEKKNTTSFGIETARKSISTEKTFLESMKKHRDMKKFLWTASLKISDTAKDLGVYGKTIRLKLKKDNFKTLNRSLTLNSATQMTSEIYSAALTLLEKDISKAPFRLIGLGLENFEPDNSSHTLDNFFNDHSKKLEDATDGIRKKYGGNSIFPGIVINDQ